MSFELIVLRAGLLALLLIAAVQDVREREVTNLITAPLLLIGIVGVMLSGNPATIAVAIAIIVTHGMDGGYGAADAKILIGLVGMWPAATATSMFAMLIFDFYWRKHQRSDSPLVAAILVGTLTAVILECIFAIIAA